MRSVNNVSFLACILFLGACDIVNPYEKPQTPVPQAWRESTGEQTTANVWPAADWWTEFSVPELSVLMNEAQQNNNDLGAAVARVKEADAQVRISGAALLPTVDLSAGASHVHAGNHSGSAGARNGTTYNAGLDAAYALDFWGKNRSAADAAAALRDASRFDRETVALTVTSSVATVYFDVLTTQARLEVAQANLTAAQQLLDALNRRFNEGVASRLDVAQQESVATQQAAALPPLQLRLSQDMDALAILLGKLPESMTPPQAKLADVTTPTVPEGLPSELLQRRPDVQFAEANLIAAHADINAARAAFFPNISLTASGGYQSAALGSLFQPGGLLVSVGANLLQPIFEGGLLTGELSFAKARNEELLQDYHKAVISAFADTEDALAAVRRNAEEEKAQAETERSAKEAFDLTQRQFSGGVVDITAVLNTQRTLFAATDAHLQARLAHLNAIANLYAALGGGWKKDAAPAGNIPG